MTHTGGDGAFKAEPLDAGPEQGGSNMGGLGATGAMDRDRDPEAEGYVSRNRVRPAKPRSTKPMTKAAARLASPQKEAPGDPALPL